MCPAWDRPFSCPEPSVSMGRAGLHPHLEGAGRASAESPTPGWTSLPPAPLRVALGAVGITSFHPPLTLETICNRRKGSPGTGTWPGAHAEVAVTCRASGL